MGGIAKGDPERMLREVLKAGDHVGDVGAAEGNVSKMAAAIVGPTGSVEAFEPNRAYRKQLRALHGERVHRVAIGDKDEPIEMWWAQTPQQSSVCEALATAYTGHDTVPMRTLDALIPQPFDVLKIDAQGMDGAVLRGARRHLRTCRAVVVECWPYGIGQCNYPLETLNLEPLGFRLQDTAREWAEVEAWAQDAGPTNFCNLFWVKA